MKEGKKEPTIVVVFFCAINRHLLDNALAPLVPCDVFDGSIGPPLGNGVRAA